MGFSLFKFMAVVGGSYMVINKISTVSMNFQDSPLSLPFGFWAFLGFIFFIISFLFIRTRLKALVERAKDTFPYKKFSLAAATIILFNFFFYSIVQMDMYSLEYLIDFEHIPKDFAEQFIQVNKGTDTSKIIKSYLGLYSLPLNISRLSFIFITSVALVMFPNISTLATKENKEKVIQTFFTSLRFSLIILLFIGSSISIAGPSLLKLLGANYALSDAPLFLKYLAYSQILLSFLNILLILLIGIGYRKLATSLCLATVLFHIPANIIFINIFGAFGAIYSSFLSLFLGILLSLWFITKKIQLFFPFYTLFRCLLSIIFLSLFYFVEDKGMLSLLIKTVSITVLYFAGLVLLKEIKWTEILNVLNFLGLKK